jgi:uncharacterized HAD superfamily protein
MKKTKTYIVDIDGTICSLTNGDYANAVPKIDRIDKINQLHDSGHTIIYWTARGTVTGIDWTEITYKQMSDWGVKYTELKLGKPHYDSFICDKAFNSDNYFNLEVNNG